MSAIVVHDQMNIKSGRNIGFDGAQELQELMQMARNVAIPEVVADYIGRLVNATHPGESEASGGVKYGASPRAALGLAAALGCVPQLAAAQAFPSKPVRIITPFPVGSGPEGVVRLVAEALDVPPSHGDHHSGH